MVSTDRSTVREVAWSEVFPWITLFSALRLAVNFRAMLLAALGLVLTSLGWALFGQILSENDPRLMGGRILPIVPEFLRLGEWLPALSIRPAGVTVWDQVTAPFVGVFDRQNPVRVIAYFLLCGIWAIAVWALVGGAITRQAAVVLARDERISLGQSLAYARSKWKSFFAAPMLPLIGILMAAIPLALFGLLLHANALTIVAAVLWPLIIVAGLVMAVLAIGLLFGWPLMWATISAEGTDSFDALSRTYAYVYQRPLHYLFYGAIALVLSSIGAAIVWLFAVAVLVLSEWGVSWGSGNDNLNAALLTTDGSSSILYAAATVIDFWRRCVLLFAIAYLSSYLWTAGTAIYYLLRRNVDGTELSEVFMPEEDHEYGLPPLKQDATGVPTAADEPAPAGGQDGAGASLA